MVKDFVVLMDTENSVLFQPPNCSFCGKKHKPIQLGKAEFEKWKNGALIQNLWPNMNPDTREIMISGTCPTCWDKAMGGE